MRLVYIWQREAAALRSVDLLSLFSAGLFATSFKFLTCALFFEQNCRAEPLCSAAAAVSAQFRWW